MPRLVDYHCFACGRTTEDVYYNDPGAVKDRIKCECGKMAHRLFGSQIYIDDWSPMTNDAQRDVEHFTKKKIRNGKYISRENYTDDKIRESVNHLKNLQEV